MNDNNPVLEKPIPVQFTKRLSNLFLVCIDGFISEIPKDSRLRIELEKLSQVIQKIVPYKKMTGLASDIQDHFEKRKLKTEFEVTEKQATKNIVLGITSALKGVLSDVGDCDKIFDKYIKSIESADNLEELSEIKDRIITATQKTREKTQAYRNELENKQSTIHNLTNKLEQTKTLAVVDSLTKILNRNAYDTKIVQVIHNFSSSGNPVSLVVCDIDHFKKFNDTHGHKAGDKVLIATAESMKNCLRSGDQIFRYGGEEFVVLLENTPIQGAEKVAEKIRSQVNKDFFIYKEKELKVTISMGVASLQEGDTEATLFEKADRALYEAKRKGRDRVVIAQDCIPA